MPSPMMPDSVARFFAASQARDVDAWSQTFAHTAVARDPVGQPELRGREQIHARMRAFLPMFRSFALVPVDAHALPDRAAVAWRGVAVTTDASAALERYQLLPPR
jgi:hypothetical protein